jgi:uncharacterized protein with ParB-like and HNH nuclease domain
MIKRSDNITIGTLFDGRKPFMVPRYQRDYAWESGHGDEVVDFIDDIKELFNAHNSDTDSTANHFFGGLVTVDRAVQGTLSGRISEVVDGQQRLATFIMLLNQIINTFEMISIFAKGEGLESIAKEANDYGEQFKDSFLKYKELIPGQGRVEKFRLSLSKADDFFFENLLKGNTLQPSRESHKRIIAAHDKLKDQLIDPIMTSRNATLEKKLKQLQILISCITDSCHVIHIESDDAKEAHRLFAILNDRGRDLSDGDLLRSYTLEILDAHQHQDTVELHWNHILGADRATTDKFLRGYYASCVGGGRAPARNLYDKFVEKILTNQLAPQDDADEFKAKVARKVEIIKGEYDVYIKLSEGDWPYDNPISSEWDQQRLSRLMSVLKHDLCIPLLLSAYSKWKSDESRFSQIVNLLERVAFRYITIVKARPGRLAEKYYSHAVSIRERADYNIDSLKHDLKQIIERDANDVIFLEKLDQLDYSESSHRKIIKHFLTTLEDHFSWYKNGANGSPRPDKSRNFDLSINSLEHVYPQNPAQIESDLEPIKHKLGNLSFWAPNENNAAANKTLPFKRPLYQESIVQLNKELARVQNWDFESYTARLDRLKDIAKKVFSV